MISAIAKRLKRTTATWEAGKIRTYGLFSHGRTKFYGHFVSLNHDLPVDWKHLRYLGLKVLMLHESDISLEHPRPHHLLEEPNESVAE